MDPPNLTRQLLRHAQRLREPVRLSMAFKTQNPEWGSQATLVAIGVTGYLHTLDWDLSQVTLRFPSWLEEARAFHAPHLLTLRSTQVLALSRMVEEPRPTTLRPVSTDSDMPALLHLLANSGLLLEDVRRLARRDSRDPHVRLWAPNIRSHREAQHLWDAHHDDLHHVTLEQYIESVVDEDHDHHPNVLYATVLRHWRQLGNLSTPAAYLMQEGAVAPLFPQESMQRNEKTRQPESGRLKA
jgi:hypothetical protein